MCCNHHLYSVEVDEPSAKSDKSAEPFRFGELYCEFVLSSKNYIVLYLPGKHVHIPGQSRPSLFVMQQVAC